MSGLADYQASKRLRGYVENLLEKAVLVLRGCGPGSWFRDILFWGIMIVLGWIMDVLYYLIKTVLISAIVGRVLRHCSRSQEKAARLFDLDLSTTPAKFSPEVDHGLACVGALAAVFVAPSAGWRQSAKQRHHTLACRKQA